MDKMTEKFIIVLSALGLIYLATSSLRLATASTFILYLWLTLVSRYPKVAIMDTFMLTDCTEFFAYLTAFYLSYPLAIALTFLGIIIPQLIEVRMEGPPASVNRILSTLISLMFFAFLIKIGVSLLVAVTICIFIAGLIWSLIEWFVLHLTNPTYFVVALVRPIVFYRVLKSIGFA